MANIRHAKVSAAPAATDPDLIDGPAWNDAHTVTLVDGDIPASIARDAEVTAAVAAEATLARNADNLASGTVADARIASTIARDSEVTTAVGAEATARDAAIETHRADTTNVHGITDTANVVLTGDARLSDARTPTGAAGGDLGGTYPNPTVSDDSHSHTSATLPAAGADLSGVDFLVGTASGLLSAEIPVGTSPGGELGGTWASPTVDATHSGSTHAATQAAAEATAAADATTKANAAQAAAIAASVPTARTITAGTGLTGGGDLSANRTLAPDFGSGAGKVTQGNDSRLSDSRTPTAHAASHKAGGSDDLSGVLGGFAALDSGLLVPFANLPVGAGASQVAAGNHTHAGGASGLVLLEQHTASASPTLDFTTFISSTYDRYLFTINDLRPATDGAALWLRCSTDGGSTFDTTAIYLHSHIGFSGGGPGYQAAGGQTKFIVSYPGNGIDNGALLPYEGQFYFVSPGSTSVHKRFTGGIGNFLDSGGGTRIGSIFDGEYGSTTAVNAIQFLFSSGNITSGIIRGYGLAK